MKYNAAFGNMLINVAGHRGDLTRAEFVDGLELFQSDVAPTLRRAIPDPPWPTPVVPIERRTAASVAGEVLSQR